MTNQDALLDRIHAGGPALHKPDDSGHDWQATIRNGNPAMVCGNTGCLIVWWPHRHRPKAACEGHQR